MRQVWLYLIGRPYTQPSFGTPLLYRIVRHPLYVGWFFAFWMTPTMTVAHLVFAVATTVYILLAIQFEERDLVTFHGQAYEDYRRRVPMLIPFTRRQRETSARAAMRREGFAESKQRHERSLAARYKGQSFELQIKETAGEVALAFHRAHLARYGYAQEKNVVEIVSARVRSIGLVEKFGSQRKPARSRSFAQPHDFINTYFDRQQTRAAVYERDRLEPGSRLRVPCIVTEYSATTLVLASVDVNVDRYSNIVIDLL